MVQTLLTQLENLAYWLQRRHMQAKMTRERVGRHYAFFHPRRTGRLVTAAYKKRTQTILVTGVFDLLHSEHIKLLKAAKKLGGKLIVGLEQDWRVRQLKGPDRPVNPLGIRMENVKKLNIADAVFALPEKFYTQRDFNDFIESLHPDILAVSESSPFLEGKRKIMRRWGGKVVVVLPHNPKISTTKMLQAKNK